MASLKITELPTTSAALPDDILMSVQNTLNKQITVQNLFGNIPSQLGIGTVLKFNGTPEIVTSGQISLASSITHLNLQGNSVISLGVGTNGQIKIIVAVTEIGTSTATISANIFHTSIIFDNVGDTATLLYTGGSWVMIGGTATVI